MKEKNPSFRKNKVENFYPSRGWKEGVPALGKTTKKKLSALKIIKNGPLTLR